MDVPRSSVKYSGATDLIGNIFVWISCVVVLLIAYAIYGLVMWDMGIVRQAMAFALSGAFVVACALQLFWRYLREEFEDGRFELVHPKKKAR